jgi:hypothetical protein
MRRREFFGRCSRSRRFAYTAAGRFTVAASCTVAARVD